MMGSGWQKQVKKPAEGKMDHRGFLDGRAARHQANTYSTACPRMQSMDGLLSSEGPGRTD